MLHMRNFLHRFGESSCRGGGAAERSATDHTATSTNAHLFVGGGAFAAYAFSPRGQGTQFTGLGSAPLFGAAWVCGRANLSCFSTNCVTA